jgi:DNA-binding NarL/FixJ family response regulator
MLFRLKHVVDLVVIDLELPNETGHGIVDLLTNIRRREASRIIAQTSRQDESFLGSVSRLGVDAILLKPTSAKQLAGTVHAMLA